MEQRQIISFPVSGTVKRSPAPAFVTKAEEEEFAKPEGQVSQGSGSERGPLLPSERSTPKEGGQDQNKE